MKKQLKEPSRLTRRSVLFQKNDTLSCIMHRKGDARQRVFFLVVVREVLNAPCSIVTPYYSNLSLSDGYIRTFSEELLLCWASSFLIDTFSGIFWYLHVFNDCDKFFPRCDVLMGRFPTVCLLNWLTIGSKGTSERKAWSSGSYWTDISFFKILFNVLILIYICWQVFLPFYFFSQAANV